MAAGPITPVLQILSAIESFDESRFVRWLGTWSAARRALTPLEAEALGQFILSRGWGRAVDQLLELLRGGRADVRPALRICEPLIGALTRWLLDIAPVSSAEKWQVLEDLAADLYPYGPNDHEVWERAGGKPADLQNHGTGRSRWHDALAQIRRGRGPRVAYLLDAMHQDFPMNTQLRYLAADSEFR
jgi:hypothetical protein